MRRLLRECLTKRKQSCNVVHLNSQNLAAGVFQRWLLSSTLPTVEFGRHNFDLTGPQLTNEIVGTECLGYLVRT